ncbi:MAG TPA: trypsin-like peptidase domain-containing protein [Vicinamibacterales bacterium]|jgi:serine protease Do
MHRNLFFGLMFVLAGFAAGLVVTGRFHQTTDSTAAPQAATRAAATTQPNALAPSGLPDFSGIAARGVSGVVNISAESIVRSTSPFANDPFFSQFLGEDEDWFGGRNRPQQSLGSGVIISADGYVVTNNHVVSGNVRQITAVLPDKREVKGQIVGRDPTTDIAVVRINATGLPVVPWADSSRLKVGQWVLAIGSPFQLNQTVTLGIVSATGRMGVGVADYEDFIQTDAAINPGNSGGALLDARGEVVGINTAILSQSGGYQGVGFAVPSNLARRVADDLIRFGEVRRGSIGALRIEALTPEWAEQLGVPNVRGALITQMARASSAFQAGLRPGDVVVGFNGQAVEDDARFRRSLSDTKIGSTATIDILREGRKMQIKVPVVGRSAPRTR